jgi:hypothetical protein
MDTRVLQLIIFGGLLILMGIGGIIYFHYFPEEKGEEEVSTE